MATTICDIAFFLPACFVTPESSPGAADGAIILFATASEGVVKYSVTGDFNYATQGTTSTIFSGLTAGTYSCVARTGSGCAAFMDLTVTRVTEYNPRFTNQYYAVSENGYTPARWKFVIEKRDYEGQVDNVQGDFILTCGVQGEENIFTPPIKPSSVVFNLMSRTENQFIELFTSDDREFKALIYKHNGSDWALWWSGFVLTGQYTAPYVEETNYPVSVTAADMLENLSKIDFGNPDGTFPTTRISIMDGIRFCLSHTDIELDIYEGIQLSIDGVTDDEDSVAETAFFDPMIYWNNGEPESCFDVLESLLRSLFSRIYQAEGRWNIETVTMKTASTVTVRTRDFAGDPTGLGYIDTTPRIMLRKQSSTGLKVNYQDRSQMMKIAETFGNVTVTYDYGLKEDRQFLLKGGDFADIDIAHGQMEGWESSTPDPTPEIINTLGREGVLKIPFDAEEPNWLLNLLAQKVSVAANSERYQLRITFDLLASPSLQGYYTSFDLSAWITDGSPDDYFIGPVFPDSEGANNFTESSLASTYLIDDEYLRYYVDDVGVWKSYSLFTTVDPDVIGSTVTGDFQLKFRFDGNYVLAGTTELKDVVTVGLINKVTDNRRRAVIATNVVGVYHLRAGTDAETLPTDPSIVRPNDYNGATNAYVWELKDQLNYDPAILGFSGYFLLHNVNVQYLPDGADANASEDFTAIVNNKTKFPLEIVTRHGDLPADENYKNFSMGWLSYNDGTPTDSDWVLRNVLGGGSSSATFSLPLIERLALAVKGQYIGNKWKQTGRLNTSRTVPSFYSTIYEVRTGKIYLPTYLSIDSKRATADIEMIQALQGEAIIDEGVIDPIDPPVEDPIEPPDPAEGRVHTDAFAAAFN